MSNYDDAHKDLEKFAGSILEGVELAAALNGKCLTCTMQALALLSFRASVELIRNEHGDREAAENAKYFSDLVHHYAEREKANVEKESHHVH